MAFDVKKWLIEDMKFSPEQAAELAPKYGPDQVAALESGYTNTTTLQAKQREVDAAMAKVNDASTALNAEIAEWATLSTTEQAAATAQRAQIEKLEAEAFRAQQALRRVAADHNLDMNTLLPAEAVVEDPSKKKVETPAVDHTKFVSGEQFAKVAMYNIDLAASLQYIGEQHRALTGQSIDPRTITEEIKKRATKGGDVDPVKVWEEMHGIPKIRADKAEAARQADLTAAEERGAQRVRSEMAIPGAVVTGNHAPVFGHRNVDTGKFETRTSRMSRPAAHSRQASAASAFATGKYRPQQ